MASTGTPTEADLIEYEVKHRNNQQNPYKRLVASGENEITCDDVSVYLINARPVHVLERHLETLVITLSMETDTERRAIQKIQRSDS
jgi:hypothetical protein